jgi:hypothetical protein
LKNYLWIQDHSSQDPSMSSPSLSNESNL